MPWKPRQVDALTKAECEEWKKQPFLNPRTRKGLNPDAKYGLYKQFVKDCGMTPQTRPLKTPTSTKNAATSPNKPGSVKKVSHSMGTSPQKVSTRNTSASPRQGPRTRDHQTSPRKVVSHSMGTGTERIVCKTVSTSPKKGPLAKTSPAKKHILPADLKWQGRTLVAMNTLKGRLYKDTYTGEVFAIFHHANKANTATHARMFVFPITTMAGMYTTDPTKGSNAAYNSGKWLDEFYDVSTNKSIVSKEAFSTSQSIVTLLHHGVPLAMFLNHTRKTCQAKADAYVVGISDTVAYVPSEDSWRAYYIARGRVREQEFKVNAARTGWHNIEERGSAKDVGPAPSPTSETQQPHGAASFWKVIPKLPGSLQQLNRYIVSELGWRYHLVQI